MPQPAMGLPQGTPAPDFTLPTAGGGELRLASLRGGWVVLFFLRGTW
jgi:peroxiredoxin